MTIRGLVMLAALYLAFAAAILFAGMAVGRAETGARRIAVAQGRVLACPPIAVSPGA